LQTEDGITDNASCERRWALRALLVLLLGVAIFESFYLLALYILFIFPAFARKI